MALIGCRQDMHDAPRYEPLEASSFFSDTSSARTLVANTVSRNPLADSDELLYTGKINGQLANQFPMAVTAAVLQRGQERYNIFCSPCHGRTAAGNGIVVERALPIGYMLWLGVALGSMGLMMIHHLSGGGWGMVVRRVWEASSRTLPLLTILFIPVALGMNHLYPWTHTELMQTDEVLKHKAMYLNPTFFLARSAVYFLGWNWLAWRMTALSRSQDEGDIDATRSMQRLSGFGLVF